VRFQWSFQGFIGSSSVLVGMCWETDRPRKDKSDLKKRSAYQQD